MFWDRWKNLIITITVTTNNIFHSYEILLISSKCQTDKYFRNSLTLKLKLNKTPESSNGSTFLINQSVYRLFWNNHCQIFSVSQTDQLFTFALSHLHAIIFIVFQVRSWAILVDHFYFLCVFRFAWLFVW